MKQNNKVSWRTETALFFLTLLFCLPGNAREAQTDVPVPPTVLHFTRALALEQAPAKLAPVTETVDEAALTGTWTPVELPLIFKHMHEASTAGKGPRTTWLRVPLDEIQHLRGPTEMHLLRWIAPGQLAIYADGQLIYRSPGSAVWNLFRHPAILLPLGKGVDSAPPRELLLRVDWVSTQVAAVSSLYAGEATAIVDMAERRDLLTEQIPFMISAGYVLVGVFALGVWIFRRQYPGHLIFFMAVFGMTRRWHFQLGLERLPVPDAWFVWLTLNALLWQVICTHYLLQFLHGRRQRWLNITLVSTAIVLSIVTLPAQLLPLHVLLFLRHVAQFIVMSVAFTVLLAGAWNAWKSGVFDARLLAAAYGLNFISGAIDYFRLVNLSDAEGIFLTPYAALVLAITVIYLMFRRYVRVMNEIESVNVNLEARIKARETELAESYERLREIQHRQTLSEERARLMQDMHDGLGSSLTSALRVVENRDGDAELREVLKSCIDDLKLTIDSMEPVEADLLLLLATLRYRLGPRLKSAGITLHWEVTDVPRLDWLDPRTSLHILRILQEALSNILKHTQASEIRVSTGADEKQVWVVISDNGAGFNVEEARLRGGRGMSNQLRRAAELGGEVHWNASAAGTRLTLLLPLQRTTP